jgi:hypothetical protein
MVALVLIKGLRADIRANTRGVRYPFVSPDISVTFEGGEGTPRVKDAYDVETPGQLTSICRESVQSVDLLNRLVGSMNTMFPIMRMLEEAYKPVVDIDFGYTVYDSIYVGHLTSPEEKDSLGCVSIDVIEPVRPTLVAAYIGNGDNGVVLVHLRIRHIPKTHADRLVGELTTALCHLVQSREAPEVVSRTACTGFYDD